MSRIAYPDPETLSDEKREVLSGAFGRVLNVSRMVMHLPDAMWRHNRALARATIHDTTLDHRLREMLILRVAYLSGSGYEIFHHVSIASTLGVTDAEQQAMRNGDFSALGAKESALAQFVTETVVNVSPSDETLARTRQHFSATHIFEMIIIIGVYMLTARVAAVGGVELDEDAVTSWR
jgi:4-carboxymuconolactone decarboxylase